MKKFYLLPLLVLALFSNLYAQITVTATSGTTTATNYTTLKAAFDAVNAGVHQGNVSISVTGNTTETASAVLNASGTGSASYVALSIQAPGTTERIISGNISAPLVDLNGADNVTIDGSNSSGSSSLTFINSNTTDVNSNSTIRFINDASNNLIKYTKILGAGTSTSLGTVLFGTGTTGNNNNTITNCNIGDANGGFPVNAVYSAGNTNAGSENFNVSLLNNNFYNFFNADLPTSAIMISVGNTSWKINNNKFFQTAARAYTTGNPQRIIQVTSGSSYEIKANIIGYSSENGTGIYTMGGTGSTRFLAIDLSVGTTAATIVQGNRLSDMSFTTSNNSSSSSGIWCAVNVAAGNVTVADNVIGSTSASGNITILPTVSGTLTVPINIIGTSAVNITNNSIGGIDVLPSGALSGNMTGIQTAANSSGPVSIVNNTIGNNGFNNMRIGTLGTTTGNGIIRGINNMNTGTFNITGNIIRNLTHYSNNSLALFRAIEIQQGTGNITGNNISNVTANGTSVSVATVEGAGILITSSAVGINVDSNTISNLNVINTTTTSGITVMGIYLSSNSNTTTISRNRIFGLTNASTSTSTTVPGLMVGIYLRDAVATSPLIVANNMISLGNAQSTNTAMIGIWNSINSATNYTAKIYYNSVNIEGAAASGAQPTFCYLRGDFAATTYAGPVVDIKNNIFTNSRTGGTGKHYAIANSYGGTSSNSGWSANASDYNILNANPATVGYWSGDQTFAGWKTASASDAHSYSGVNVTYVNSASDLHLVTTTGTNAAADGKATSLAGFNNDIDNDVRNAATPDIGADEFTQNALAITVEYFKGSKQLDRNVLEWKAGCTSTSVTFNIERSNDARIFKNIGSITASKAQCASPFNFADANAPAGKNYYRLKMMEADGNIYYSSIIAMLNKDQLIEIVGMLPTLVQSNTAVLNVSTAQSGKINLLITDEAGRTLIKQASSVAAGVNNISLNLNTLTSGVYFLTVYAEGMETRTIRFVKQ